MMNCIKDLNLIEHTDYKWLWNRINRKTGIRKETGCTIRMKSIEAAILHNFCSNAKIGIVEIGRKFGGSTYVISKCSTVPVYSVDTGKFDTHEKSIINKCIEEFGDRLHLINCKSSKAIIPQNYDVLFIDGDHTYNGVMRDIKTHWEKLTGVCIFHDYITCHGVTKAVDYILSENIAKKVDLYIENQNIIVVEKTNELTDYIKNWKPEKKQ